MESIQDFLTQNEERLRQFEAAAKSIQEEQTATVLALEERYRLAMEAPLPRKPYPNTDYWAKWGPAIDAFLLKQRQDYEEELLAAELMCIEMEFSERMQNLEATFFPEGLACKF